MNTLEDLFPSKYLKASDAEQSDLVLTIKEIKMEEMNGDNGKEQKPVVYFQELEKGLVLNKTNKETIQKLHGNIISELVGKKISLFSTEVQSFGEMTLALRVRLKIPQVPAVSDQTKILPSWAAAFAECEKNGIAPQLLRENFVNLKKTTYSPSHDSSVVMKFIADTLAARNESIE